MNLGDSSGHCFSFLNLPTACSLACLRTTATVIKVVFNPGMSTAVPADFKVETIILFLSTTE